MNGARSPRAISHGLARGCQRVAAAASLIARVTVGSTESPSGSHGSRSSPLSITIFTGTRCTILTKLPVAFSAGKAENREPEPIWMLSHVADQLEPGIRVDADTHRLARAHLGELASLKFAVTQTSGVTISISSWPTCT